MSAIIAIDPGLTGAIALLDGDELHVWDMPTRQDGKRAEVDGAALALIVGGLGTTDATLERVGAMPQQGLASAFNFGDTYGCIRGVLEAYGYTITRVTPAVWKFQVGLPALKGVDNRLAARKHASRARAQDLFPHHAHLFARVKDDGRAEAALMAWWFVHKHRRTPP